MKHFLGILLSLALLISCSKPGAVAQSELNTVKYNSLLREIGIAPSAGVRDNSWGGVTFTGSSTIALWTSLVSDFPGFQVRNTGVGGTTLREVIANSEWMVFANYPQALVLYIGDNDARAYDINTFTRYMDCFVENFFHRMYSCKLILVSVKPSPARKAYFDFYNSVNSYLSALANQNPDIYFVDIWTPMVEGKVNSFFSDDGLHLNSKGYRLLTESLTPVLTEIIGTEQQEEEEDENDMSSNAN